MNEAESLEFIVSTTQTQKDCILALAKLLQSRCSLARYGRLVTLSHDQPCVDATVNILIEDVNGLPHVVVKSQALNTKISMDSGNTVGHVMHRERRLIKWWFEMSEDKLLGQCEDITPKVIKNTRLTNDLSTFTAGAMIYESAQKWTDYEDGRTPIHPALWELFCIKLKSSKSIYIH